MKSTFIIYLLAGLFSIATAQDSYHVINIKGKVSRNGKKVKRGQKLSANDQVKFLTPRALLLVSSQRYGRKVLSGNPARKSESEVVYMIKSLVIKTRASAGFAASELPNGQTGLLSHFGKDKHLILGNEERILVDKKEFILNQHSFFLLRYEHEGKTVEQKIPHEANQLIFNQEILNKNVVAYTLIYQKEGNKPQQSGAIKLVQLYNKSEGKKAVDEFVAFLRKNKLKKSKIKRATKSYLKKYFGTPHHSRFYSWFKANYGF